MPPPMMQLDNNLISTTTLREFLAVIHENARGYTVKQYEELENRIERLIGVNPSSHKARTSRIDYLTRVLLEKELNKEMTDYEDLVVLLKEICKRDRKNSFYLRKLGECFQKLGVHDRAMVCYDEADKIQ